MTIDGSLKYFRPRYFDDVDTVTGTSEADVFEVEPLKIEKILFPPRTTQTLVDGANWALIPPADEEIRVPGRGRAFPKERPQSSEVDILVYQEKERDIYLDGFQAPTARSYTYIEDFEPIEDSILVDGGKGYVTIMSDENDIPMFTQSCIDGDGCERVW